MFGIDDSVGAILQQLPKKADVLFIGDYRVDDLTQMEQQDWNLYLITHTDTHSLPEDRFIILHSGQALVDVLIAWHNRRYDMIFCSSVVMTMPQLFESLAMLSNMLKADGALAVTFANGAHTDSLLALVGDEAEGSHVLIGKDGGPWTLGEITRRIESAGFVALGHSAARKTPFSFIQQAPTDAKIELNTILLAQADASVSEYTVLFAPSKKAEKAKARFIFHDTYERIGTIFYRAEDEEYAAARSVDTQLCLGREDSVSLELPWPEISELRFDPVELMYCRVRKLRLQASGAEFFLHSHNGIQEQDALLFFTSDPSVIFSVSGEPTGPLTLTAEIEPLALKNFQPVCTSLEEYYQHSEKLKAQLRSLSQKNNELLDIAQKSRGVRHNRELKQRLLALKNNSDTATIVKKHVKWRAVFLWLCIFALLTVTAFWVYDAPSAQKNVVLSQLNIQQNDGLCVVDAANELGYFSNTVTMTGWAIIPGFNTQSMQAYLRNMESKEFYAVPTETTNREDVMQAYNGESISELNGFSCEFSTSNVLATGTYRLYFRFTATDGSEQALETNHFFCQEGRNFIYKGVDDTLYDAHIVQAIYGAADPAVDYRIDNIEHTMRGLIIEGWAYLPQAVDAAITLCITSTDGTHSTYFSTTSVERQDVATSLQIEQTNTGFRCAITSELLPTDASKVTIIVGNVYAADSVKLP